VFALVLCRFDDPTTPSYSCEQHWQFTLLGTKPDSETPHLLIWANYINSVPLPPVAAYTSTNAKVYSILRQPRAKDLAELDFLALLHGAMSTVHNPSVVQKLRAFAADLAGKLPARAVPAAPLVVSPEQAMALIGPELSPDMIIPAPAAPAEPAEQPAEQDAELFAPAPPNSPELPDLELRDPELASLIDLLNFDVPLDEVDFTDME
jgi:hypothetical protein